MNSKHSAHVMRLLTKRTFAAQPAAKASPPSPTYTLPKEALKTTTLSNGLVVASVETYSPVSRIAVFSRAGSRFETSDNLGVSHALRISAGLSTKDETQFAIARNLQQTGGVLTCSSGREHLSYTLKCTRKNTGTGLKFLGQVATAPVFNPWELSDNWSRLKLEVALMEPQVMAFEFLHKAAFRSELGNSLYCPKYKMGTHDSETLKDFVNQHCTANRSAVVGWGADHSELVAFAEGLPFGGGAGPQNACKYTGGEIRKNTGGDLAYVVVATEGASYSRMKNVLSLALLQHVLGSGPSVKYGSAVGSKLSQAIAGVTSEPFAASAFSLCYADSGLFGYNVVGQAKSMDKVLKAVTKVMQSPNITDADVARGKAQLKMALRMSEEHGGEMLEELGLQVLLAGKVVPVEEMIKSVDAISASDITTAAQKLAGGKMSMGAVGNLQHTPYLDQLK